MDIMGIIRDLQARRRESNITPDHVPEVELMDAIHSESRQELNRLYKTGKIGIRQTLNGKAVFMKE